LDADTTHPVHPCLCGFDCESYKQMKKHRRQCVQWQNRPNAVQIMIERRRKTRKGRPSEPASVEICSICHHRCDHHDAGCPNSQAEAVRRDSLKKHGIDPFLFEIFLRVLAKRYDGK
jgi:hypothetical protein